MKDNKKVVVTWQFNHLNMGFKLSPSSYEDDAQDFCARAGVQIEFGSPEADLDDPWDYLSDTTSSGSNCLPPSRLCYPIKISREGESMASGFMIDLRVFHKKLPGLNALACLQRIKPPKA